MSVGAWVLIVGAVVALAFGATRLLTDGRFRGSREIVPYEKHPSAGEDDAFRRGLPLLPADQLGERATLLQFSSAFCAPCRATRRTLADVADRVPGVAHVEVDAESHLELVRRLNILRTPTTVVLDAEGREVTRAAGAPKPDQVLAALDGVFS